MSAISGPSGPQPDATSAAAYLARIEKLLTARGLDSGDKRFKADMRRIATAFQARDYDGVTAACDALVDLIEGAPAHEVGGWAGTSWSAGNEVS